MEKDPQNAASQRWGVGGAEGHKPVVLNPQGALGHCMEFRGGGERLPLRKKRDCLVLQS